MIYKYGSEKSQYWKVLKRNKTLDALKDTVKLNGTSD